MANVTVSSVIDAPVEQVWPLIRDFNGLPNWHPRMVESEIEAGQSADTPGAIRRFKLVSGVTLREKLVSLSDADHSLTYSIEETPQPISEHLATIRLIRITDGNRTFAEWSATFSVPADQAEAIAKGMGENVFQGGFDALNRRFKS